MNSGGARYYSMLALVKYDNKWNILLNTPLVKLIFSQPPTASSYHTKARKLCEAEKPVFFFCVSLLICLSSPSFSLLLCHLFIDLFPVWVQHLTPKTQYIKTRCTCVRICKITAQHQLCWFVKSKVLLYWSFSFSIFLKPLGFPLLWPTQALLRFFQFHCPLKSHLHSEIRFEERLGCMSTYLVILFGIFRHI